MGEHDEKSHLIYLDDDYERVSVPLPTWRPRSLFSRAFSVIRGWFGRRWENFQFRRQARKLSKDKIIDWNIMRIMADIILISCLILIVMTMQDYVKVLRQFTYDVQEFTEAVRNLGEYKDVDNGLKKLSSLRKRVIK